MKNLDLNTLKRLHLLILLGWLLPYKKLVPLVILLNVIGLVFMTLEYVFSNYSFWQEGMGIRMAFTFAGIWIVIYAVLLAIAIGIGFLLLLIKNTGWELAHKSAHIKCRLYGDKTNEIECVSIL